MKTYKYFVMPHGNRPSRYCVTWYGAQFYAFWVGLITGERVSITKLKPMV